MPSNLQRKLTLAGLVGKIDLKELINAPGERMDLALIRGIARRYKADQSALGEFVRFFGSFRGTNVRTGEIQDAPQMIAPPTLQDMLYGAIGAEGDREVAFAMKVGVRYDATAITKYVYEFQSLMEMSENDPLTRMDRDLKTVLDALPKPAVASLPAPGATVTDPTRSPPPVENADSKAQAEADAGEVAAQKEREEQNARVARRVGGRR